MEYLVGDGILEGRDVNVVGRADTGHTDGMRTYAVRRFQMFGMHQQSHEVVAVGVQAEQYTDTYIIDSSLHGAVHGLRMVGIVALRTSGVKLFVILLVVRFLEQNVGTDTGLVQATVILYRGRSNIYVYPTDGSVLVLDTIDSLYRLQNVFDRIVNRIFSSFQCQTLVPHVLQGDDFTTDVFLCQFLAGNGLVLNVVRTVGTTVYAVV